MPCAILKDSLGKVDFRVSRDSLYAQVMSFIRQIATVKKILRLLEALLFLPNVSADINLFLKR